ncbi:MAG: hypothetical protein FWD75_09045 [Propionibacteriaceae bacterium]|nr:hypothetical protein [Propionibacteriaceae bacterium]
MASPKAIEGGFDVIHGRPWIGTTYEPVTDFDQGVQTGVSQLGPVLDRIEEGKTRHLMADLRVSRASMGDEPLLLGPTDTRRNQDVAVFPILHRFRESDPHHLQRRRPIQNSTLRGVSSHPSTGLENELLTPSLERVRGVLRQHTPVHPTNKPSIAVTRIIVIADDAVTG